MSSSRLENLSTFPGATSPAAASLLHRHGTADSEARRARFTIAAKPPVRETAPGPSPAPSRLRINRTAVRWGVRLGDAAVITATGALAYSKQSVFGWPLDMSVALAGIAIFALTLRSRSRDLALLHDVSRAHLSRRVTEAALRIIAPFALTIAIVLALPNEADRSGALLDWLGMWALGAVAGIIDVRLVLAALAVRWRNQGRLKEAVAIYGTGEVAHRLIEHLRQRCGDTIEIVGVFDDRSPSRVASPRLRSLLRGSSGDLIELSRKCKIDRVVVALPHAAEERVLQVVDRLCQMPIEIGLAPDLVGFSLTGGLPEGAPAKLGGLPLLVFYRRPLTFGQSLAKNTFDKVVAALAILILAPTLIAVAIAIKLDSRGPVLFRQNRYGFGNRVIRVYKFRTMCAEAADLNGTTQTQANDPRITRIGRHLRRWSLDQLPQLFNVLGGAMSLVGPRPHAISMRVDERLNEEIVPDYAMRHHLKPGITGWAQVNGYHGPVNDEAALRGRVAHDLEYINRWSLWFDLVTIVRTIKLCLGQRHAF